MPIRTSACALLLATTLASQAGAQTLAAHPYFDATPPDLEAGRLLAETYARLRQLESAERTLRSIIERAPGDIESHTRLERTLVQKGDLAGAIAVLSQLSQLDPLRAKPILDWAPGNLAAMDDDHADELVELGAVDPARLVVPLWRAA